MTQSGCMRDTLSGVVFSGVTKQQNQTFRQTNTNFPLQYSVFCFVVVVVVAINLVLDWLFNMKPCSWYNDFKCTTNSLTSLGGCYYWRLY